MGRDRKHHSRREMQIFYNVLWLVYNVSVKSASAKRFYRTWIQSDSSYEFFSFFSSLRVCVCVRLFTCKSIYQKIFVDRKTEFSYTYTWITFSYVWNSQVELTKSGVNSGIIMPRCMSKYVNSKIMLAFYANNSQTYTIFGCHDTFALNAHQKLVDS